MKELIIKQIFRFVEMRAVSLVLLVLSIVVSYGQNNLNKGMIITKTGDTLITGKSYFVIPDLIDENPVGKELLSRQIKINIENYYLETDSRKEQINYSAFPLKLRPRIEFIPDTSYLKLNPIEYSYPLPVLKGINEINKTKRYSTDQITTSTGIPSNFIWGSFQDSNGNLWIGTSRNGLIKITGNRIYHFNENSSFNNVSVRHIMQDSKGNMWFSTDGAGLIKYDGKHFFEYNEGSRGFYNKVLFAYEDSNRRIWVGFDGNGLAVIDGEKILDYSYQSGFPHAYVRSFCETPEGMFYGHSDGISIIKKDGSVLRVNDKEIVNHVDVLEKDGEGVVWIGTDGGGIFKMEGQLIKKIISKSIKEDAAISSICPNNNGTCRIALFGEGIVDINGNSTEVMNMSDGLLSPRVTNLFQIDNILFVSTFGEGLQIINLDSYSSTEIATKKENIMLRSLLKINDSMWIVMLKSGILELKGGGEMFSYQLFDKNKEENYLLTAITDGELIWAGFYNLGIKNFNTKTRKYYSVSDSLNNMIVYTIVKDRESGIWLGTQNNGLINIKNNKVYKYAEKQGFPSNTVRSSYIDSKGDLWFGTRDQGIVNYNGNQFKIYGKTEGLNNLNVRGISSDSLGRIWFGTEGGGVHVLFQDSIYSYTTLDGLSSNNIYSLLPSENITYAGTDKGLDQIYFRAINSSKSSISINSYHKDRGMSASFVERSFNIDSIANKLHIITGNSIYTKSIKRNNENILNYNLKISGVLINSSQIDFRKRRKITGPEGDEVIAMSDGILSNNICYDSVYNFENVPYNLELPYNANHLTFEIDWINWRNSNPPQYQYIMSGLDDTWSIVSSESKIDYRNIPPGNYVFQIKSIYDSNDSFSYPFVVLPPWWSTWWARLIFIIVFLLIVIGYIQTRIISLKRKKKELEYQVKEATREIMGQKNSIEIQRDEIEVQKNQIFEQKIEIEHQHELLQIHHKEITDSMVYAKRLQEGILPNKEFISRNLKNGFLVFQPKEHVSGDFYWMNVADDLVFFAAADCTGHGVPGAMVSVVCSDALDKAVREFGLRDCGEILDKAAEIVTKRFERSGEEIKDGMDIAMARLDWNKNKIQYSGANNPFWIVRRRNGGEELEEGTIFDDNYYLFEKKATKQPVGKFEARVPFESFETELIKGDNFYLFSDGFPDQFGGPKGKKYMSKNFKKLLVEIHEQSADDKKNRIIEEFSIWKGDLEQIDDICIFGLDIR